MLSSLLLLHLVVGVVVVDIACNLTFIDLGMRASMRWSMNERTYEHDNEMLLVTAVRSQLLLHNCDDRLLPFACNASSKSIRVRYKFVENLMKWEYHTTIITKHRIFRWQRKTETERARVLNCIKKVRCLDLTDFLFGGDNVTYIYTKENYRTLHACIRSKLKFANYVLMKGRGGFFNFSV